MKTVRQWAAILAVAIAFTAVDLTLYAVFTRRYIDRQSEEMKGKSVEISAYLPFEAGSRIVHTVSEDTLTGDLPVLDGAAAFFPVFSAFAEAWYPADSVFFNGSDFGPDSALRYSNTRGAYRAVVDGTVDMIFCVGPSEEQLAYAGEKGVELTFVPIGREAFVFLVSAENPVDDLTVEQIKGLFSGAYRSWAEVGGDDTGIDALQRNAGSGSQTFMLSFMEGTPMKRSLWGALSGRAVGFSFRYYVEGIVGNGSVKMLSLNGAAPTVENIASGAYPIVSPIYAVYDASNDNPNVERLLSLILSETGQRIIRESGYVPISDCQTENSR